jgi:hypothetical protein
VRVEACGGRAGRAAETEPEWSETERSNMFFVLDLGSRVLFERESV